MGRQFTQKSFIFALIILAVAAVVYFLVWNEMKDFNQVEPPNPRLSVNEGAATP